MKLNMDKHKRVAEKVKKEIEEFEKFSEDIIFYDQMPNDIKKKMDYISGDISFDEPVKVTNKELFEKLSEILTDVFSNWKKFEYFCDIIVYFYKNLGRFLLKLDFADKKFYSLFKKIILKAKEINNSLIESLLSRYLQIYKNKLPVDQIIYSILILRESSAEGLKDFEEMTFKDYLEIFLQKYFNLLEDSNEKEFKLYLFDWILKFGYLLEGYIKEILIFYLKLCLILKNDNLKSYKRIVKLENRYRLTLGRVLNELAKLKALENPEWGKIRNAIFHTSFDVNYEIDLNERTITFYDRKVENRKNLEIFIEDFFHIIKVIRSVECVISELIKDRNTIIQALFGMSLKEIKDQFYS